MFSNEIYILLVDDNVDNLLALEAILGDYKHNLIWATSGREALKQVLKYNFVVILMDAHMPDLNGFETARIIRLRDKSRYIPIIFLTAYFKDEVTMNQAYSLGAIDYIERPINPYILRSKVKVFIDLYTKSSQAKRLQYELEKRQIAENELIQLNTRIQLILSSAGEGIFGLDQTGKITFANPATTIILGMGNDELINQSVDIMLVGLKWDETPIHQALKDDESYHVYDTFFRKKCGKAIPVEYTVTPSKAKTQNKDLSLIVVFKDTTERKKAENLDQLRQRQLQIAHVSKLTTAEEIASALAHELNQPLTAIVNYTKGTVNRLNNQKIKKDELLNIMNLTAQQADRAGKIIHRLKNFIAKGKLYYEHVAINEVITSAIELIRDELQAENIQINFKLCDNLPMISIDRVQLTQVILNLARNSLEAMQDPQLLRREIIFYTTKKNNSIQISISDTGSGFHPENEDKLFDMYFTTKSDGMGIGLAICRSVIEAHGGLLSANNNHGGGCCFDIVLPITQKEISYAT